MVGQEFESSSDDSKSCIFHSPLLAANKHQHRASSEANQSSDGAYAGCFSSLKMLPCYVMASYLLLCKCSASRCWTAGILFAHSIPNKSSLHKGAQMESLMFCSVSLS